MPLNRMMGALGLALGLLVTTVPAPATAGSSEYGRTWRKDGALREDCHPYKFQYRIKPGNVHPGGDWLFEVLLVDRTGEGVAHAAKDASADPKRGAGVFQICDTSAEPGRFKIRGKLTVYPEDDSVVHNPTEPAHPGTVKWVKPSYFRLR